MCINRFDELMEKSERDANSQQYTYLLDVFIHGIYEQRILTKSTG